ncbi:MAG: Na(+)-translocating NADH-quinone reductase subunit A [Spirochaetia bacterium]|nr:Na(+)-translocating NADH-quinone reductase subunit A [Spirochaetia bacterium]
MTKTLAKLTEKSSYRIKIKKGLDLQIDGAPELPVQQADVRRVALLGDDYPMLKPSIVVSVGDTVKIGQVLFFDREHSEIKFTSPGAGQVVEINRGEKRRFESIVIALSEQDAKRSADSEVVFAKYDQNKLKLLSKNEIIKNLLISGLWTSLRNRPFGTIADPSSDTLNQPNSIFITAVDSNPHSVPPSMFIDEHKEDFETGAYVISKLTSGKTWLVKREGMKLPEFSMRLFENSDNRLVHVDVSGPHPSGNVGTHIHFLDPVGPHKNVWYINYQDVIAVGHLFIAGKLLTERLVSVSGPACLNSAFVKTRLGASIDDLVAGRKKSGEQVGEIRQVSGSLMSGSIAAGSMAYLGRYHHQISLIEEGRKRKLFGWLSFGFNKFSAKNIYVSNFIKPKSYEFNTSTNGSSRAMVPIEIYEKVMPLDIHPVFLLRSILMGDIEHSEELGVLELEEEDLALCTFVSPGKDDFGYLLRTMLNRIRKGE